MWPIEETDSLALLTIVCDSATPLRKADDLVQGRTPSALLGRPCLAAFSYLRDSAASNNLGNVGQPAVALAMLFRQPTGSAERVQVVFPALAVKLALIMSTSPGDVEPSKPLSIYGNDSLMAVKVRN
ncbi:uncharacterized protein N7503_010310 [Penicillium pulvis]|uniref:uncharacterized protein n=1 Tax=Penicillium pulvis TaxID=1562058 RepID=UPI0025494862|nr:uncharacterized protein N7503_010310 [Penicillium pulvis]KAJ5785098.1 hypothetical protein N7503_010310 [Penicillium pulvis]